jgi:D-xylose transport system permease protein
MLEWNDAKATVVSAQDRPRGRDALMRSVTRNLQSTILVLVLITMWIGFGFAAPGYATANNVQGLIPQMAIVGIMACGMVLVIVTGGIDLSVGYGAGFVSVVAAALFHHGVVDGWLSARFPSIGEGALEVSTAVIIVIISLLLGLVLGAFQGYVISRLSVPPFIVTLGGYSIFKSGILIVTQGRSLYISHNDSFKFIAQGLIPPAGGWLLAVVVTVVLLVRAFTAGARRRRHTARPGSLAPELARAALLSVLAFAYVLVVNRTFDPSADPDLRGVPLLVVILGLVALLMSNVCANTPFGRHVYAIGGNREAARLSGIGITGTLFGVYVIMGALMAVSGVALAAYVGSGTTNAGGGYELDVIASCILGGTSTLGGEGTVFGALVGALVMQSLSNGLQLMNVNSSLQYGIKGVVLILAVLADVTLKRRRR